MTPNCVTPWSIYPGVNLTPYQGVNAHEYWVSGVFCGVGCGWGADPPGIRLPCFERTPRVKCLFINYLVWVLASPGPGGCNFQTLLCCAPCDLPKDQGVTQKGEDTTMNPNERRGASQGNSSRERPFWRRVPSLPTLQEGEMGLEQRNCSAPITTKPTRIPGRGPKYPFYSPYLSNLREHTLPKRDNHGVKGTNRKEERFRKKRSSQEGSSQVGARTTIFATRIWNPDAGIRVVHGHRPLQAKN